MTYIPDLKSKNGAKIPSQELNVWMFNLRVL
jgi:hypothetical protein